MGGGSPNGEVSLTRGLRELGPLLNMVLVWRKGALIREGENYLIEGREKKWGERNDTPLDLSKGQGEVISAKVLLGGGGGERKAKIRKGKKIKKRCQGLLYAGGGCLKKNVFGRTGMQDNHMTLAQSEKKLHGGASGRWVPFQQFTVEN